MTGNSFLLDTSAAIGLLNRRGDMLASLSDAERLFLPLIAVGELEVGARGSGKPQKNLDALERLLKEVSLILPDRATAATYGEIESKLRRKGRPIPTNDIWIAASAMQHGLEVLTADAHYARVPQIVVRALASAK